MDIGLPLSLNFKDEILESRNLSLESTLKALNSSSYSDPNENIISISIMIEWQ